MSSGLRSGVPRATFVHLFPSGKMMPPSSYLAKSLSGPPLGEKSMN